MASKYVVKTRQDVLWCPSVHTVTVTACGMEARVSNL